MKAEDFINFIEYHGLKVTVMYDPTILPVSWIATMTVTSIVNWTHPDVITARATTPNKAVILLANRLRGKTIQFRGLRLLCDFGEAE